LHILLCILIVHLDLHILLAVWRTSSEDQEKCISGFLHSKLRHYPRLSEVLNKTNYLANINFSIIINELKHPLGSFRVYSQFIQEAAVEDELTNFKKSVLIAETESIKDELIVIYRATILILIFIPHRLPCSKELSVGVSKVQ